MSRVLGREPGVVKFDLNTVDDIATVVYDPMQTGIEQIKAALTAVGYPPGRIVEQ